MHSDLGLYIDGKFVKGGASTGEEVLNPASNEVLGHLAHASNDDLDAALTAAERGFDHWRRISAFERSEIMRRAAGLLRERSAQIARAMTLEQGKPIAESTIEVMAGAEIIDWFADEGRRAYGRIIPARPDGVQNSVLMEPVGPVAAFAPWNFPVTQATRKIAAAVAAGCSIIIKSPEETPASSIELVRCFHDAGVPAGVVNLVFGIPAEISEYLIPSPIVRKVSFTGSIPVGKHLGMLAARHMKRTTMELGGHAPVLVFDDADVDRAATLTSAFKFRNAGQVCISPTRFFLHEKIYDRFVDRFTEIAGALKVGNGLVEGTQMGPLANSRRIDAMQSLIGDAVDHGARIATGGNRIGNQGNFFEPTVLENVPDTACIMTEEPFGPVAVMAPFSEFDDVIERSNNPPFGLAGYAFTESSRTAARISDALECGMVSINHNGLGLAETPFGGMKESGFGHEGGQEGLQAYLTAKFVSHMRN